MTDTLLQVKKNETQKWGVFESAASCKDLQTNKSKK